MSQVACIDTLHNELPGAIAAYLVMGPEPVLVDPGPATVLARLEEGLAGLGVPLREVKHVAVTHVHLDHAGGVGHLVERNPALTVHLHEDAAVHLVSPDRLVASTRVTFGDAHDRLWGEVRPVPAHAVRTWRPGDRGPFPWLRALPTPGHIPHHLGYLVEDQGLLLAGDSMGILLHPEAPSHPPTPPPAVDLRAWLRTLDEIAAVGPERVGVTHFGVHNGAGERGEELRRALLGLAERVEAALASGEVVEDARAFDQETRGRLAHALPQERVDRYLDVFSAETDYRGLQRYLERNRDWRSQA